MGTNIFLLKSYIPLSIGLSTILNHTDLCTTKHPRQDIHTHTQTGNQYFDNEHVCEVDVWVG
jgi:hypothetical protein